MPVKCGIYIPVSSLSVVCDRRSQHEQSERSLTVWLRAAERCTPFICLLQDLGLRSIKLTQYFTDYTGVKSTRWLFQRNLTFSFLSHWSISRFQ